MLIPRRSVLIVDSSEETREVLRTALEKRGMRILSASRADEGLVMARQHRPDLIVLDMEMQPGCTEAVTDGFTDESRQHDTPLVLLGTARRCRLQMPREQFVAKPYHYTPLIRRIEALLEQAPQPVAPAN